ncbi:MAG: thermonuclease family protein [Candidatus Omnitrophota bacterium]
MRFCNRLTLWGLLILGGSLFISVPCQAADPLTVTRVVDGDTLQLSNGEKVCLIGADAPESSNSFKLWRDAKKTGQDTKEIIAKGEEAAEFTRKLVEGKQVKLEYDSQKKDKYGRILAYVYVFLYSGCESNKLDRQIYEVAEFNEGTYFFLNASIIKAGYAQVIPSASETAGQAVPPNVKYQALFLDLQKEAMAQKRGLWRDTVEADQENLDYKLGLEDATGLGNVRASSAKIGVDYKVSENSTVGVEARQGIHDTGDAKAWGQSVDDETAAQAKYKISF